MSSALSVNVFTAFLAGIVSFVSPCVLPLIPAYLSFLTGSSVEELKAQSDAASRVRTMLHALCFVAGFTVVFMAIGLSASALGSAFVESDSSRSTPPSPRRANPGRSVSRPSSGV